MSHMEDLRPSSGRVCIFCTSVRYKGPRPKVRIGYELGQEAYLLRYIRHLNRPKRDA